MLHGRDGLQIPGVVALHAADELHREAAGEEWVLPIRLLTSAPARIPEQVDVRRPEREPLIALARAMAHVLVMLRTSFIRDDGRHPVDQGIVPRAGDPHRLRKRCREPRARDAVQCLVPPVVSGNAKPVDRRRDVLHLRDFFLERHARDEIGRTTLERQVGILIVRRLRAQRRGDDRQPHQVMRARPPGVCGSGHRWARTFCGFLGSLAWAAGA